MSNKTLYIFQGVAGAGKSTYAKKMIEEGKADVHFEADMWLYENGIYKFSFDRAAMSHNKCREAVRLAILEKKNVIQSNTNLNMKDIKPYFDLAWQHQYNVEVLVFRTSYGSIHNVPDFVIENMKKKLENFDWTSKPSFVNVSEVSTI